MRIKLPGNGPVIDSIEGGCSGPALGLALEDSAKWWIYCKTEDKNQKIILMKLNANLAPRTGGVMHLRNIVRAMYRYETYKNWADSKNWFTSQVIRLGVFLIHLKIVDLNKKNIF